MSGTIEPECHGTPGADGRIKLGHDEIVGAGLLNLPRMESPPTMPGTPHQSGDGHKSSARDLPFLRSLGCRIARPAAADA